MGYKKRVVNKSIITGTKVEVRDNKIELAIKKFKRKVKDADIMLELRDRRRYTKKSNRLREKRNLAQLRNRYRQEKENNPY
mgnify:CR=1 FL=1